MTLKTLLPGPTSNRNCWYGPSTRRRASSHSSGDRRGASAKKSQMQMSDLGRHESSPDQSSGSRMLRVGSTSLRTGVGLSSTRHHQAQDGALKLLLTYGFSAVRYDVKEDGWKVVNNRSLEEVCAGPLYYADAFRISEDLNAKVTRKVLRMVGAV